MQALHFHLYLYKGKSFYYNRTFQFYRKENKYPVWVSVETGFAQNYTYLFDDGF